MKKFIKTVKYLFLAQVVLMFSLSMIPFSVSAQTAQYACPVWGCNYQPTPINTYSPLIVSCYANYSGSVLANTSVTWSSIVSGGNGVYTYSWNGTDGLTGNMGQISTAYSSAGMKSAFVSVTSAGQTVSANCGSLNVYLPTNNYYYPYNYYPYSSDPSFFQDTVLLPAMIM